jgi:adenosylcobinamide kinase/adenosylcobinamide-phosphate guanylyltransferase
MRTFLIGGARSGKSSLAAQWAAQRSNEVCCVVTATRSDREMAARIDAHRRERPPQWRVREEPLRLAAALQEEARSGDLLLVDCLTLWTANCLWPSVASPGADPGDAAQDGGVVAPDLTAEHEAPPDLAGWHAERDAFLASLRAASTEIIVVSNEVGASVVPENPAARVFRDEQGRLNQLVAAACDSVFLVTAGLALRLK